MHGLDKLVFGDIGLRFVVSNQRCLSLSVSNKRQGKPEVRIYLYGDPTRRIIIPALHMQYAACASHVTGASYNCNTVDLVILYFHHHPCYLLTTIDIHDLSNQEIFIPIDVAHIYPNALSPRITYNLDRISNCWKALPAFWSPVS